MMIIRKTLIQERLSFEFCSTLCCQNIGVLLNLSNLCLSCQYEFILSNKQRWELCTFHDCTRILYAVLEDISSLLGNIEECLPVMKDKVICLKYLAQNKRSENINYFCFPQSLFSPLATISYFSCMPWFCLLYFFFSLKLSQITHSDSLTSLLL